MVSGRNDDHGPVGHTAEQKPGAVLAEAHADPEAAMTPAQLVQDILDTHHAYLYDQMPALDRALSAPDIPDAVAQPWRQMIDVLEEHLQREEDVLFPAILSGEAGDLGPVMDTMTQEHDLIRACERTLRGRAALVPEHAAALLALLDDLAIHAAREDDELFAAVRRGDHSTQ